MILFTSFIKRSGVIGHLWRVIHVYFISHLAASAHRTCSGAYEEEDGGTDIISINSEVRNLRACIAWYGPCLFFDRVRLTLGPSGLQGVKQFQCEVMALISLTTSHLKVYGKESRTMHLRIQVVGRGCTLTSLCCTTRSRMMCPSCTGMWGACWSTHPCQPKHVGVAHPQGWGSLSRDMS